MSYKFGSHSSVASLPLVLFVASVAALVQSYVVIKLFFLALFVVIAIVSLSLRKQPLVVHSRLVLYYVWLAIIGIIWAMLGLITPGNFDRGALDALRLYVIWSAAFVVLYSFIRADVSLRLIHNGFALAAILISTINFVGLADQIGAFGIIPDSVRQELDLYVGIHDGYIQITSSNIGALFVIVPYLLSIQFRADTRKLNTAFTKLALALALVTVAISGRRALWLVVAFTPILILTFSLLTDGWRRMSSGGKRVLIAVATVGCLGLGAVLQPEPSQDLGYISHLKRAFSSDDARGIQKDYLIRGFVKAPVLGAGFGAYAGYLRNDERPWTYELTYHRLIFNVGSVGIALFAGLFVLYYSLVIGLLRRHPHNSAIPFGLLVGSTSLLLGAATNPYLGSFDYLFLAGLLPYLATFRHGFDECSETRTKVELVSTQGSENSKVGRTVGVATSEVLRRGP